MFALPQLSAFFQQHKARRYLIAYSGGLDSHVLLHACCAWRALQPETETIQLRAIHVDHGLQAGSGEWLQHCQQICVGLAVSLISVRLDLSKASGSSEAVARKARYRAFAEHLKPGEILLTAHHQDDQAETLLLNLLRGAGSRGLAAMPGCRRFQETQLCRPLLHVARAELEAYAQQHQLRWVEDPSNQCEDFDRNFLRRTILPQLQQRWPAAASVLARAAQWQAENNQVLARLLEQELVTVAGSQAETLSASALLAYPVAEQKALLRHWLATAGFQPPDAKKMQHILQDILQAKADATPLVRWADCEVRRYRDELYVMSGLAPHDSAQVISWADPQQPLWLDVLQRTLTLEDLGALSGWVAEHKPVLTVRFRQGGETLKRRHRPGIRLKHFFQEQGVPPWQRDRLPLIYAGAQLIAIPGYYQVTVDDLLVSLALQKRMC